MARLLLEYRGGLFARISDAKMKSALKSAGFVQQGIEWKGRRKDLLSLWIRT
jgi:hypothetical protein